MVGRATVCCYSIAVTDRNAATSIGGCSYSRGRRGRIRRTIQGDVCRASDRRSGGVLYSDQLIASTAVAASIYCQPRPHNMVGRAAVRRYRIAVTDRNAATGIRCCGYSSGRRGRIRWTV